MNSLQWQSTPSHSSPPPAEHSGVSAGSGPWFGIALLLIGMIVGYVAGNVSAGGIATARTAPPSVAAAPSPSAPSPAPVVPTAAPSVIPVDFEKDHIRGSLKAEVALIEYSDFECPYCKRAHPTYKQLLEQNGSKVMWVYRHYPLSFHQNAAKEAEAVECANELGGNTIFWKYTDLIFDRTTSGGTGIALDQLAPMAKELGLNEAKFQNCLDSGKYAQHAQDDESGGSRSGISGTPGTIVLNLKTQKNQVVSGAVPVANFQAAIDAVLQ